MLPKKKKVKSFQPKNILHFLLAAKVYYNQENKDVKGESQIGPYGELPLLGMLCRGNRRACLSWTKANISQKACTRVQSCLLLGKKKYNNNNNKKSGFRSELFTAAKSRGSSLLRGVTRGQRWWTGPGEARKTLTDLSVLGKFALNRFLCLGCFPLGGAQREDVTRYTSGHPCYPPRMALGDSSFRNTPEANPSNLFTTWCTPTQYRGSYSALPKHATESLDDVYKKREHEAVEQPGMWCERSRERKGGSRSIKLWSLCPVVTACYKTLHLTPTKRKGNKKPSLM